MAAILCLCALPSCEKSGGGDALLQVEYIIVASSDKASYLIQTDGLTSGQLSIVRNGKETDTGTAWLFYKDKYLYRLAYNQSNAGTGSSYYIGSNGMIAQRNILFEIKSRFTTYGIFGQHLITAASGATADMDAATGLPKYGVTFTYIDVEAKTLSTKTVVTENMVDDRGEYYTVSGSVEHGGKK